MGGGILEQNIARTAASVGEALVAGAIFTIPAFLMVEINGSASVGEPALSTTGKRSLILLVGGLIGVFFIVILRRPLCVGGGFAVSGKRGLRGGGEIGPGMRRRAQVHFRRRWRSPG